MCVVFSEEQSNLCEGRECVHGTCENVTESESGLPGGQLAVYSVYSTLGLLSAARYHHHPTARYQNSETRYSVW